jgi:hypothetical protein
MDHLRIRLLIERETRMTKHKIRKWRGITTLHRAINCAQQKCKSKRCWGALQVPKELPRPCPSEQAHTTHWMLMLMIRMPTTRVRTGATSWRRRTNAADAVPCDSLNSQFKVHYRKSILIHFNVRVRGITVGLHRAANCRWICSGN